MRRQRRKRPQHGDTKGKWEEHPHDYAICDDWGAAMKDAGPVPETPMPAWKDIGMNNASSHASPRKSKQS